MFSIRSAQHRWDPKHQRPELWRLYNVRRSPGESMRVFPLSNWTELDVWQYIHREQLPIVPLYLAAPRPVVERDGTLIMVDDDRMPLRARVSSRSCAASGSARSGCYPLTGAIESTASTLTEVIQETLLIDDVGAPGPRDRPRPERVDGEEEAGGLLLMASDHDLRGADIDADLGV